MGNIFKVLAESEIKSTASNFPTRFTVELCENIHIHYRDLRLELDEGEFSYFALMIAEAAEEWRRYRMEKAERKHLPIDSINPWDAGHREAPDGFTVGADTQKHIESIEYIKELIKKGKNILPILVKPLESDKYQRLDGFCRYMAFKQLGHKEIECFIDKNGICGGQDRMPLVEKVGRVLNG